jgi:hypothetical protein
MRKVRLYVVALLAREYGMAGEPEVDHGAVLERMIRSDPDPAVRTAARRCLLAIRPEPAVLYGLLADDQAHMPVEPTEDLAVEVSRLIVKRLLTLDEDAETGEREAMARFLRRLMEAAPGPLPEMEPMADWDRPDPVALGEVARSMQSAGRPATRAWAAHVFGKILRSEARAELSPLLVDEDPDVRMTAAGAIQPVDLETTSWLESLLPAILDLGPEGAVWMLASTVRDRVSHDGKRALLDLAEIYLAEHPLHPMGVHFVDQLLA